MTDSAREIENLLYTYAERIDAGDLEGVADLFTHGRVSATPGAPDDQSAIGRDAVLENYYQNSVRLYPSGTPLTRHVTTNAIVEVAGGDQTATSRSSYCVVQATDVLPLQPIIVGRYHDTFQRVDGEWWFDVRIMFVDLMGDLSQHLKYELH